MRVCELVGAMRRLLCVIFLANSSENAVRATAGCELLRVRAARVVTLKNRVRVVRDAVWCEPRGFFSEFIIKKVRAAVGCELLRVRAARVVTLKNRRM